MDQAVETFYKSQNQRSNRFLLKGKEALIQEEMTLLQRQMIKKRLKFKIHPYLT
jgi:hypothetical protein